MRQRAVKLLLPIFILFMNSLHANSFYASQLDTYQSMDAYQQLKLFDGTMFHPTDKSTFGREKSMLKTELEIVNDTNETINLAVMQPRTGLDRLDIDIRSGGGHKHYHIGDRQPLSLRPIHSYANVFPLHLKPRQSALIEANTTTSGVLDSHWYVMKMHFFEKESSSSLLFWGAFGGLMLALVLYNGIYYMITKSAAFIVHALYAFFSLLTYYTVYGISYYLNVIDDLKLVDVFGYIVVSLAVCFHLLFPLLFFNIRKHSKFLTGLLLAAIGFMLLSILYLAGGYVDENILHSATFLAPASMLCVALVLFIALFVIKKRLFGAWLYLLSQLFLLTSAFYSFLVINGFAQVNPFQVAKVTSVMILLEVIFINLMMARKLEAQLREKRYYQNVLRLHSNYLDVSLYAPHVVHQWKRPLADLGSVTAYLTAMIKEKRELPLSELENTLTDIDTSIKALHQITNDVYTYLSSDDVIENIKLDEFLQECCGLFVKISSDIAITVDGCSVSRRLNVSVLRQILFALLDNSLKALDSRGIKEKKIFIRCESTEEKMVIEFGDNAGGVKKGLFETLCIPYVSSRNGLGSGLYTIRKLVESKLEGKLEIENTQNGLRFRLSIGQM